MILLEIRELTKVYRSRGRETRALDAVSLEVGDGEVLGLLGPNGSGKTTLIKIVARLVLPTDGAVWLDGTELRNSAAYVTVVAESGRSLYWRLTVDENLMYMGSLRGASKESVRLVRDSFELGSIANTLVGNLSTGQKQRVAVAVACLGNPRVIILDEPTTGLDILWRDRCCDAIKNLAQNRHIPIVVASHDLEVIGQVSERIAILNLGRLVALRSRAEFSPLLTLRTFAIEVSGRLGESSLVWLSARDSSVVEKDGVTSIRMTVTSGTEIYGLLRCLESESLVILRMYPTDTDITAAYRYYMENQEVTCQC